MLCSTLHPRTHRPFTAEPKLESIYLTWPTSSAYLNGGFFVSANSLVCAEPSCGTGRTQLVKTTTKKPNKPKISSQRKSTKKPTTSNNNIISILCHEHGQQVDVLTSRGRFFTGLGWAIGCAGVVSLLSCMCNMHYRARVSVICL